MALIERYANDYLARADYYERLKWHRNLQEVRSDILRQLSSDMMAMQNRIELRNVDLAKGASGYATSVISQIWKSDKRIKELYRRISHASRVCQSQTVKERTLINHQPMSIAPSADTFPDNPLKVFLSYSWDDPAHKAWVLALANRLQHEGIYVILDQYDLRAGKVLTHFMEQAVANSDKVVLVLTPAYKQKADNRTGGAGFECSLISQEIYENQYSEKFIPVIRKGNFKESAPNFIKPIVCHDMSDDVTFKNSLDELLRLLYGQPAIVRPPLGKRRDFTTMQSSATPASGITHLINDAENVAKCRRPNVAHWTFVFELRSLADESKPELYRLFRSNLLKAKDGYYFNPFIFNDQMKTGNIEFIQPLQSVGPVNQLSEERLQLEEGMIQYEFAEYSDHEFMLLMIMQPFTTLVYLLAIIRAIHEQLAREVDIAVRVGIATNKKAMLYSRHSPFQWPNVYNFQNMILPGNKGSANLQFKNLSNATQFRLFKKIYELFTAEDPRSAYPCVELDRTNFNNVLKRLLE